MAFAVVHKRTHAHVDKLRPKVQVEPKKNPTINTKISELKPKKKKKIREYYTFLRLRVNVTRE